MCCLLEPYWERKADIEAEQYELQWNTNQMSARAILEFVDNGYVEDQEPQLRMMGCGVECSETVTSF